MFKSIVINTQKHCGLLILTLSMSAFSANAQLGGTISIQGQIVDAPCVIQTANNKANLTCTKNGKSHHYSIMTDNAAVIQQEPQISQFKTEVIKENVYLTSISYS